MQADALQPDQQRFEVNAGDDFQRQQRMGEEDAQQFRDRRAVGAGCFASAFSIAPSCVRDARWRSNRLSSGGMMRKA